MFAQQVGLGSFPSLVTTSESHMQGALMCVARAPVHHEPFNQVDVLVVKAQHGGDHPNGRQTSNARPCCSHHSLNSSMRLRIISQMIRVTSACSVTALAVSRLSNSSHGAFLRAVWSLSSHLRFYGRFYSVLDNHPLQGSGPRIAHYGIARVAF